LLQAYKNRLGQNNSTASIAPIAHLLHIDIDLTVLEAPFTHDEIDAVVKEFPHNKSRGPDGFNAEFLKNAGQSLKQSFMNYVINFIKEISVFRVSMDVL
jgi:hypothetical protein